MRDEYVVRYTGKGDRSLSSKDFGLVGLDSPSLSWNSSNGWKVSADKMDDQTIHYLVSSGEFIMELDRRA